ncbi:hypothetical protein EYF80_011563 [Liparis tanakae]|uniref:Uncharacterized protein n=1 Tax=Liparis tanakae TaxID=230148 RepID=A0A4Z2IMF0_9TELE|nr:hypothetical protein EYF80_011563 [Liparis tanakae]
MSGSGLPLAAHSIVAVRVRSTTFNCGPMSMVGKPGGSWSSAKEKTREIVAEGEADEKPEAEIVLPGGGAAREGTN